jgi:hypothetical protein
LLNNTVLFVLVVFETALKKRVDPRSVKVPILVSNGPPFTQVPSTKVGCAQAVDTPARKSRVRNFRLNQGEKIQSLDLVNVCII